MKVKFIPQNIEVEASPDKTLLQIANENNIEIKSICKGVPSCAECRVNIAQGEHNIVPPGKAELSLIGTSYYIDSRRLSCQVRCFGDVTVDLTEQVERAANQSKKVRGFRTSKTMESKAVQDTMILNEKIEADTKPQASASQGDQPSQQRTPRQQQSRPQQNQQKAQNPNQQQRQKQGNHPNQKQGKQGAGPKQNNRPPPQQQQQKDKKS